MLKAQKTGTHGCLVHKIRKAVKTQSNCNTSN